MTQPTNTFDTYDAVGRREDLSDMIWNISPTDTPFISKVCSRTGCKQTLHEWQTDTLAAVDTNNKVIEGDDVDADAVAATARRGNYTQLSDKSIVITSTMDAVDTAGRKKESAYQIAKRGKELKRDMEAILSRNQARAAGNSSTARAAASMESWIATNVDKAADGTNPTGDGTDARSDGTQRAFTETMLKSVIRQCWTSGGDPSTLLCGPFNKQVISGFTGGATRMDKSEDQKLFAAIDVYVSDFGELKTMPSRFNRDRTVGVLDTDYWALAILQDFKTEPLAKTGHSNKWLLSVEYTLVSRNQGASGVVADLTTS